VLQLGKSLGLPVVAEGIDCDGTVRRLSELACAIGQGHYFGGALTAEMVKQRHAGPAGLTASDNNPTHYLRSA
jgi:EAL domain-containing protein (putative c-di-GMP-specific phosphodiesterase class I)